MLEELTIAKDRVDRMHRCLRDRGARHRLRLDSRDSVLAICSNSVDSRHRHYAGASMESIRFRFVPVRTASPDTASSFPVHRETAGGHWRWRAYHRFGRLVSFCRQITRRRWVSTRLGVSMDRSFSFAYIAASLRSTFCDPDRRDGEHAVDR